MTCPRNRRLSSASVRKSKFNIFVVRYIDACSIISLNIGEGFFLTSFLERGTRKVLSINKESKLAPRLSFHRATEILRWLGHY